ncbi:MAG: 3-hydroxyacyl-CoA dehydrogenase NAD-binding domain-containing protein [Oscillospiraceae bacterium]|nr:3-hydroxyacyl-CoA dehydrogenase NAD-binding domain-containing protein [Oscillospiraceae bacterium]
MKIGILGYGKMGREIFHAFFDQTKHDLQLIVCCRHDTEAHAAKVQKELDKGLRRKKFSAEIYQKKQNAFSFTTVLSPLSDCYIIIESITEQMQEWYPASQPVLVWIVGHLSDMGCTLEFTPSQEVDTEQLAEQYIYFGEPDRNNHLSHE